MFLTNDQKRILSVLELTGWLRLGQILRLLRVDQPKKTMEQVRAAAVQLSHTGKAILSGDIVCLPRRRMQTPDEGMLTAVDVLLDLSGGRFKNLEPGGTLYTLRFQVEAKDEDQPMGVIWIAPGAECSTNAALRGVALDRTVILALADVGQMDVLDAPRHSFFAVRDTAAGRLRFYKGGDA